MTRTESFKVKEEKPKPQSAPKPRAVKQMRFHIGIQVPGTVKNSLDHVKDKCDMTLLPMGVEVEIKESTIIVPYANIHYIEMLK